MAADYHPIISSVLSPPTPFPPPHPPLPLSPSLLSLPPLPSPHTPLPPLHPSPLPPPHPPSPTPPHPPPPFLHHIKHFATSASELLSELLSEAPPLVLNSVCNKERIPARLLSCAAPPPLHPVTPPLATLITLGPPPPPSPPPNHNRHRQQRSLGNGLVNQRQRQKAISGGGCEVNGADVAPLFIRLPGNQFTAHQWSGGGGGG